MTEDPGTSTRVQISTHLERTCAFAFCAIQVKNRNHDAFTTSVKETAMTSLEKVTDSLRITSL